MGDLTSPLDTSTLSLSPANALSPGSSSAPGSADTRFHDLRHTCATLLLSQGTHPKLVQTLLGYATIAVTLDTYSHSLPSIGDQTLRAMEAALS